MLILCGKTASGKTTFAKMLEDDYGMKRIVTYTTRKQRKGEVDGQDYHFISKEKFERLVKESFFLEKALYKKADEGDVYYGAAFSDLYYADYNDVIILTPSGIKTVMNSFPTKSIYVCYVNTPDELIKKWSYNRGDDNKELERRMYRDSIDFEKDNLPHIDLLLNNDRYQKDKKVIVESIYRNYEDSGFL